MDNPIRQSKQILKFDGNSFKEATDEIAVELPFTIYVDGDEFATMVCTPTHLKELVIGFLASEGFIRRPEEINALSIDEARGFAYVELVQKQTINKEFFSKRFIGSCCGKSRQFYFHNDARTAKTITSQTTISIQQCFNLMEQMQHFSADFQLTGGVHTAALCSTEKLLVGYSDIGRHNALDKIYGSCLLNHIAHRDKVIVFSGRISSEVLLKVAKIGAGIILSKSAPTSLALDLAHDLGITAVGFIRNGRLNVYTHSQRVTQAYKK